MNPSLTQTKTPSLCFVHDWLVAMRGGEKVLEAMTKLFPDAPIYTLFLRREKLSPFLQSRKIYTSFLQIIPGMWRFYRWLLPIFPIAVRMLNLQPYDIVISSSHCVAKAARVRNQSTHICYCHTPMRYLWGFEEDYLGKFPRIIRWLIERYFKRLRKWDIKTSQKVDVFVANSENTATKIRELYGKKALVVHPPVDVPDSALTFNPHARPDRPYFLIVSALVPYKKIDIAIEALNRLKLPLKIVGEGPLRDRLEKMVRFDGIQLLGLVDSETLWHHYAACQALIFPGEEDFGIVPLEAQWFGKPVIAYGKGGALETVLAVNDRNQMRLPQESTGLFFYTSTAEALAEAVRSFQKIKFEEAVIRAHARRFGRDRFEREFLSALEPFYDPEKWEKNIAVNP